MTEAPKDEQPTRTEELNDAEQKALNRFAEEGALAFQDLVDEGLMDRATAAAVRHRLVERGLVKKVRYKPSPQPRGRPRVLYALKKAEPGRKRRPKDT